MQSTQYTYYNVCCCYTAQSVSRVCYLNSGGEQDLTSDSSRTNQPLSNMNLQEKGDLYYVHEYPVICFVPLPCFCFSDRYYKTQVNGMENVRTKFPCCMFCCVKYDVATHEGTQDIGKVIPRHKCCCLCPYVEVQGRNGTPEYQIRGSCCPLYCLKCWWCDLIWDISDTTGSNVGRVTQSGCPTFPGCKGMYLTDVQMPVNADPERRQLIAASLPIVMK